MNEKRGKGRITEKRGGLKNREERKKGNLVGHWFPQGQC
jgi:hypothetical protein